MSKMSAVKNSVKYLFVAVALALLTWAVWQQRSSVAEGLSRLGATAVSVAIVSGAGAAILNALSWRSSYRAMGADLPLLEALRVFLISQIGKYLPGSVWPVFTQVEMSRRHGISRSQAATASIVSMLVGTLTAALASLLVFVSDSGTLLSRYWPVLVAVPLIMSLIYPPVLNRLLQFISRYMRRYECVTVVDFSALVQSCLWSGTMWVAFGIHFHVLVNGLAEAPVTFAHSVGTFALAWVAGFLFIIAPAGVGVRESVFVIALGDAIGAPQALTVAVLSRALLTVIDAGGLALAGLVPMLVSPTRTKKAKGDYSG